MRVRQITKTVEQVVGTEYMAHDGKVFNTKAACVDYEKNVAADTRSKLKLLCQTALYVINPDGPDSDVEIFYIQTQDDLEILKEYLHEEMMVGLNEDFAYVTREHVLNGLENVTIGHEVIIQWWYDREGFSVYGNGSIEDYGEYFKRLAIQEIERQKESYNANAEI